MKAAVKRILIFLLSASLLLLPGCADEPEEKAPSNYEQLYSLLGQPAGEVCKALGIDEAQVDLAIAGKAPPPSLGEARYAGLLWETTLLFNADKLFCGFTYTISYSKNPEQAAPIFADMLLTLEEDWGSPFKENNPFPYHQKITQQAVLSYIQENSHFDFYRMWNLSRQFMEEKPTVVDEFWRKYPTLKAYPPYFARFSYAADLDTATLTLAYKLFPVDDLTTNIRK